MPFAPNSLVQNRADEPSPTTALASAHRNIETNGTLKAAKELTTLTIDIRHNETET